MTAAPHLDSSTFDKLLTQFLSAGPHSDVLVIYDCVADEYLDAIFDACCRNQINPTFILVPRKQQLLFSNRSISQDVQLPGPLKSAIRSARYIMFLVSPDLELMPFRRLLLTTERDAECRFLHVPGVSSQVLHAAHSAPSDDILRHAQALALTLASGDKLTITTNSSLGTTHVLECVLGGWDNEPLMSPGVIFPGGWGNLPPGEVFICPDLDGVNGSICINGSIPDSLVEKGQDTVLQIIQGRLVDWSPANTTVAKFLEEERGRAKSNGDSNWNAIAEIGIGLNPAISTLSGNSLLDEKSLGTAHIALGDNSCFNHPIKSNIHADLVVAEPTLRVDDLCVIDQGQFNSELVKQVRDRLRFPRYVFQDDASLVPWYQKIVRPELGNEDLFSRRIHRGSRVGHVPILADSVGRSLNVMCRLLAPAPRTRFSELAVSAELADCDVEEIASILYHLRMVHVDPVPLRRDCFCRIWT